MHKHKFTHIHYALLLLPTHYPTYIKKTIYNFSSSSFFLFSMFPYSPSHAAHLLFGVGARNSGSGKVQNEAKKGNEVKFLEISEYFFISHPSLGQKEGREQERLMFFSPSDESISKQIEISGMAEAIVNFTSSLPFQEQNQQETTSTPPHHNESEYRYVTSANSKEVIMALENGEFIIGTSLNKKLSKEHNYALHSPTIRSVLERAYHAYKLFFGHFGHLFGRDRDFFKCNLERFFTPYLQLLRLNKTPLVDLFNGVDFLPLENLNFLEVHCLMTNCMEEFPAIKMTMFLYQERLIQYSVEKSDLIPLWHFISQTLIPAAMLAELSPQNGRRGSIQGIEERKGFLVDGTILVDFLGEFSPQQFPRVFISDETGEYSAYDLIAYRVLNATACFFIPSTSNTTNKSTTSDEPQPSSSTSPSPIPTNFLDQLVQFLDSPMSTIASKIGDKFLSDSLLRPILSENLYHFIYFNPDSFSLKKSFPTSNSIMLARNIGGESQSAQILPPSMYRLIFETYDKFTADQSMLGQIYLKADNDWWIVFKRVERRILALFLSQNAATTIADVQLCVDGILKSRFTNLFIST